MEKTHDTFADLHPGTPGWFTMLARLLPIGLFAQFASAGLGLFLNPDLVGLHASMGFMLSLPATGLLAGALFVRRLRGFGWWAGLVFALYVAQVSLAATGAPLPLSLHPANAALLLTASLVLLAKVERRRAQHANVYPVARRLA
jgi:Na+/proline symporter